MQIRKVKLAHGLIIIRAEEQSGEEDIRRIELESRAEPRPEFHEAMGGLILPALEMIEAPFAWKAVATISGLSLTHEEDRGIGAVVTILVPLECAPSPLVLNTPYLLSHMTDAPGLPDDLRQAIERVIDEALRYMRGDRAQGDLFEELSHAKASRALRKLMEHDADGVVAELEPAEYVAGKLVLGQLGELEPVDCEPVDEQSAAEPESLSDGPILDRPPHEVCAELEPIAPGIRDEAMHRQPVIKPARGRRPVKA